MKTVYALIIPGLLFGILNISFAADHPKAVDVDAIKDKVRIAIGEEVAIEFKRVGNQLLEPAKTKLTETKKPAVEIHFEETTASPVPPPKEGATRPFIRVTNNFEKALQFHVLVRPKDNQEFIEINRA